MRTCLLITWPIGPDLRDKIAAGEHPRMEVLDLAYRLGAEIIDSNRAKQSRSFLVKIGRFFSGPLGLALLAWLRRSDFDLFYAGNEKLGLLIAALFKLSNHRPRIVILNHYLSNPYKVFWFRLCRLETAIDALICLNECQATFLERTLAVSPRKVFRIRYGGVDGTFFRPCAKRSDEPKYILTVGRENRDYATFIDALRDSGIRVKIVASGIGGSGRYRSWCPDAEVHNVEIFEDISYTELRYLYKGCAFVVVPVHNVDYPAGVTAILEAMAMGKAVIATYSRGIDEFIHDSVTGFWTETGDPIGLRGKIRCLWDNPGLAREMGERGREWVKSRVDLTAFVRELESIVTQLG